MNKQQQLQRAAELGKAALSKGYKAPAQDPDLMALLGAGREIGKTPPGEASTVDIFKAWNRAHQANCLAQKVE